jgi:endo-alpha-N-acetylgalactosaminidase
MANKMKNIVLIMLLGGIVSGQFACTMKARAKISAGGKDTQGKTFSISSKQLEVTVDGTFPRVIQYVWKENGAVLYGQPDKLTQIKINGELETPKVRCSLTSDTAKYELACKSCVLDVEMKVVGNVLEFQIASIKEDDAFRVNTIEIPQHSIISIRSTQPNAVLATALIDADKSKCGDTFTNITASTEVSDKLFSAAYAILSTEKLAASIETNSIYDYPNKFDKSANPRYAKGANKVSNGRVKYEYTKFGDTVVVGLSSGQWTYRADQSDKIEPAPYVKVVLTPDLRDIMYTPRGAERTPDRVAQHICFNFASDAGFPFLRALDNVKRVYYATDGLGQFVLLKGYQSEGHDSAHSDFGGNIGRRMGGKKDMNILVNEGDKWGADIGVHLNCTESYPEAKCFSEDFANPKKRGWGWLDQSYYIYHRKDLTTGYFAERINELKQDVPGLDFIYMDVYFGDGWEGLEMARTVQQADMDITTEFPKQIEHSAIWSHWSTDMTYGPDTSRGINSQIVRFIRNHQKDMYLKHPLLGHAEIGDFEGWQGRTGNGLTTRFSLPEMFG